MFKHFILSMCGVQTEFSLEKNIRLLAKYSYCSNVCPICLTSINYMNPFFTYFLSELFPRQVATHISELFHILQFKRWKSQRDSCN